MAPKRFKPMTLCYMAWTLTIKPCILIQNILFSFIIYRKFMYIPDYSIQHSRNFRSTPDNTINRGTWHYSEPIQFNASLKPPNYSCIFYSYNIPLVSIILPLSYLSLLECVLWFVQFSFHSRVLNLRSIEKLTNEAIIPLGFESDM